MHKVYKWIEILLYKWIEMSLYKWIEILLYKWIEMSLYKWIEILLYKWIEMSLYKWIEMPLYKWIEILLYKWIEILLYKWIEILLYKRIEILLYKWIEILLYKRIEIHLFGISAQLWCTDEVGIGGWVWPQTAGIPAVTIQQIRSGMFPVGITEQETGTPISTHPHTPTYVCTHTIPVSWAVTQNPGILQIQQAWLFREPK